MAKDLKPPTFEALVKNDGFTQFCLIVPGLVLLMAIALVALPIFAPPEQVDDSVFILRNVFLGVFAILAIGCGVMLQRRVSAIAWMFAHGERVKGKVTKITPSARGFSTLDYSYTFGGDDYTCSSPIQSEPMTTMKEGHAVTVLVDPKSPAEGMLAEAFQF